MFPKCVPFLPLHLQKSASTPTGKLNRNMEQTQSCPSGHLSYDQNAV